MGDGMGQVMVMVTWAGVVYERLLFAIIVGAKDRSSDFQGGGDCNCEPKIAKALTLSWCRRDGNSQQAEQGDPIIQIISFLSRLGSSSSSQPPLPPTKRKAVKKTHAMS